MSPQEASVLATKLVKIFGEIPPAQFEILETILERFPYSTAEDVISRYAQETATLDRGKLRTLLIEEHSRRSFRISPTPKWRQSKDAETKVRDEVLNRTPRKRLEKLIEDVRQKLPAVSNFLQTDLLVTDIGRSLIYHELMNQKNKQPQPAVSK